MKHTLVITTLVLALFTTGCEINGITGVSANGAVEVDEGSYNVIGRTFQNAYGTLEFQEVGQNGVQFLQTCNQGDLNCNSMNREDLSDFMVNLNDSRSYSSRSVGSEYWDSWISGSSEQLTVITQVRDVRGIRIRSVRESFRITDSPCGNGGGRGLEARQMINYGASYDNSNATRTCQAYY